MLRYDVLEQIGAEGTQKTIPRQWLWLSYMFKDFLSVSKTCHLIYHSLTYLHSRALLKRHMNVHSGQKDFTCGSCDYATSHKSNLERHIFRLHGESAGNSYKATRTPHAKRRLSDDKSMEYSAKRYQSLSSLDNLELEDVKPGFMNLPGISFATGKPRLCATNYSCSSCNLAFGSQIESSLHSRTCEILKNCEKDMVRAAFILLQLKHSRESLN